MSIDLEVVADEKAAARRAAELIAAAGAAAVADHGSFSFAMSGGRSPWSMLAILGDLEEMPWRETELFQVDERVASPGSDDRNLTHMVLGLSMDHQSALRPMPVTHRDLDQAAHEYENSLPDRIDLVHLGLGPDGHTASLVPGDPVLEVIDRRVAVTTNEYQGHRRMTLTYRALAEARQILWLVTGEEKRGPLQQLLAERPLDPRRPRPQRVDVGSRRQLRAPRVAPRPDAGALMHTPVCSIAPASDQQDRFDVGPVLRPVEHRLTHDQVLGGDRRDGAIAELDFADDCGHPEGRIYGPPLSRTAGGSFGSPQIRLQAPAATRGRVAQLSPEQPANPGRETSRRGWPRGKSDGS